MEWGREKEGVEDKKKVVQNRKGSSLHLSLSFPPFVLSVPLAVQEYAHSQGRYLRAQTHMLS